MCVQVRRSALVMADLIASVREQPGPTVMVAAPATVGSTRAGIRNVSSASAADGRREQRRDDLMMNLSFRVAGEAEALGPDPRRAPTTIVLAPRGGQSSVDAVGQNTVRRL